MTVVVVAEKPSVARDIARVLGARRKRDGYLEGNGYAVTWALGHLVQLAEPNDYGGSWAGRWSLAQLPMVPDDWRLKIIRASAGQFRIVKKLINDGRTQGLVCATDAGREGENIFRLIYRHARCRKPFQRLWISSLTEEAIAAGFRTLQPGSAFDDLARAALARTQADWLVGLNLTRAYTAYHRVLLTIGRVQTPTLAMIAARDRAIAAFQKHYFYELIASLAEGFQAKYCEDGQTRIETKTRAEQLHARLSPHRTGTVLGIGKKVKRFKPPPLYDLITLQKEANKRFGFTAARVLQLAQQLYEIHKLITYPRTESRHISEDMLGLLPGILAKLEHPLAPVALERLRAGHRLGKAHVDRTKLTDHHGILPTGKVPSPGLDPSLRKVFDLIAARFVAIFLPDHVVEETEVRVEIGGASFVARGKVILQQGWKEAEAKSEKQPTSLPVLQKGQTVHVDALDVVERETSPPKPFTDATLLAAMKNAGRTLEDEDLAAAMKESGLGTPATRAEIIEKLIRSGLIVRKKKALVATDKGKALIGVVADPLKSPELTAQWEQRLRDIENGCESAEAFYQSIVSFVNEWVPRVGQSPRQEMAVIAGAERAARPGKQEIAVCPACGQGKITEGKKAFGCSRFREGCRFLVWKKLAGKNLTANQVRVLLTKRITPMFRGFRSKAGKKFAARLKLDDRFKVVFDFSKEPGKRAGTSSAILWQEVVCPRCGRGRIIEGKRGFGCNRYKQDCHFVIWKEISGKKLTEKQIHRLITRGKTLLMKGFQRKNGGKFQAYLKLDDTANVGFQFPQTSD